MVTNDKEGVIKSDETLLTLLSLLKQKNGATVTELADDMDLAKSSVYRHLKTLLINRYVIKEGSEYKLGLRFLDLGGFARAQNDIYSEVKPIVSQLASETGEFVSFITEEHGMGVFLYIERQGVPSDARVGKEVYLHQSAAGKAILSQINKERREEIIDQHGLPQKTENTITDKDRLYEEIEGIQDRGYAYVEGDHTDSLWGVGVPVLHPDGRVLGGITLAGPSYRLRGERMEKELPELLKGKMKEFELQVTYF